jgi:hypothetical protein
VAKSSLSKLVQSELKTLYKTRDRIVKEISHLESFVSGLFGGKKKTKAKRGKGKKGKRGKKRSTSDLAKLAKDVHQFIVTNPGVMAGTITKKFGKLIPSPKEFLKRYGITVKTKGPKRRPTYHV